MNKTISQNGKKFFLALFAVVAFALNANAGSTWYAYYVQSSAYPTGKGQVYMSEDYTLDPESVTFEDKSEYQFTSTAGALSIYTKPADGYIFAGISAASPIYDEMGAITGYEFNDNVLYTDNPAMVTLASDITDNPSGDESIQSDSTTVAGMMPLDPNNVFYALFTKIKVTVPASFASLGSATISKVCNDAGDEVTITATPTDGCTFVNWTDDFGNVVSDKAEYTFTVGEETATYTANFTSPNLVTVRFPETGGYVAFYDAENDITLMDGMTAVRLVAEYDYDGETGISTPKLICDTTTLYTETSTYAVSCQNPYLLYGFGKMRYLKSAADPDYIYVNSDSYMRWSGDNGVEASELTEDYAYYSIDLKYLTLTKTTDAIPAKTMYVAIPTANFQDGAPLDYIVLSDWAPQGVLKGDVNEDGVVNIADVNAVISIMCGND